MQNTTGVTGAHTNDGIPHGYTTITYNRDRMPVDDGDAAR